MITDYWSDRKALFIGFRKDHQYHGILNSQNRLKDHLDHISIGTWDGNRVMNGFGIKLQRNKVAYYGEFKQGKITDNNCFYIGDDGSIQKGSM